ncbi:MAG: D-alanyl-D-alanine carboxypeptidase [Clostridia bacterium]|nr:D-alanyl-D-alanine carboxypeptidase [Clostridia bacterium]
MKQSQTAIFCFLLLLATLLLLPVMQSAGAATTPASAANTCARCMAVVEGSTGRLLYGKNEEQARPMASTTKICTAATVLEHCDNLDRTVAVPDKAVGVEGSSIYLQKGEKVKIIDLLYGLMLQSGNDCAEALAITVGGSIEDFAAMMNETAKKAGARNSNFVNPHGLHDDNHYTTAHDLALIAAYAFRNPVFAQIVATKRHTMPWEGRNYPRVIVNKNKILSTYEGGDGVKTGFTKKAGRCLVSSATRNGMRVIAVVLDCGPMFEECAALMDKAFAEYSLCKVADGEKICEQVPVSDGKRAHAQVCGKGEFYYPLREDEKSSVRIATHTVENLAAPVKKDTEAGNFEIYLENQLLFGGKLYTIYDVAERGVVDKWKDLVDAW